jgi:hypothetical protein
MSRIATIMAILGIVCGFCFGMSINRTEIQYIDKPMIVEIPKYVEVPVEKEIYVDKIVYQEADTPRTALQFPRDRAELEVLIEKSKVEEMGEQRCVAEAVESVRRAAIAGYLVSWQCRFGEAVEPEGREWGTFNSTFIGQTLWFYNPVTGQTWPAGHSIKAVE